MDAFDTRGPALALRQFEIHDRATIAIGQSGKIAELWYPIIADTPYQRVLDLRIQADFVWRLTHDVEIGNRLLHATVPSGRSAAIELSYLVERRPTRPFSDSNVAGLAIPNASSGVERWLRAEKHIEVTHATESLALEIVAGETDAFLQAKRIFDYVTSTMVYDATRQSHVGSSEHAMVCSVGNCSDIHALFISLARSVGIPARLVLGQALQPELDLCGYHCWAEFFVTGMGWVPADASCACKYAGAEHFGRLDINHVAWSVGRDILLTPAQRGPRLIFFAGPYLELDGVPHTNVSRTVTLTPAAAAPGPICEPCVTC